MYKSMAEVRRANANAGRFFFSPDTMDFFDSRVESGLYGGRYFITSEKKGFQSTERAYTVREAKPDGSIETVGGFLAFNTLECARESVRDWIKEEEV